MSLYLLHGFVMFIGIGYFVVNPLLMVLNYGPWAECRYFCQAANWVDRRVEPNVLVKRDFATTCTCTCQHYYAIFMHSACADVHMYMHTYALCGYTRQLRTCRYVAIHVNRPSGISQAAATAVNRTQGVNKKLKKIY